MGINMDIRNEPKYSFLDLRDLDEADKNKIAEILRLNTSLASCKLPWDIGEKEYEITGEMVENPSEDATNEWQQQYESGNYVVGVPEGIASYETCEVQSSPIMTAAMTTGHPFPSHPQMITYAMRDFTAMSNPYGSSVAGDPNAYSYIQYGPPPSAMYPASQPELMSQPASRENERRGPRNRGGKRDSYQRGMNSSNEMQTSYIMQGQNQYGQILPMCHTSGGLAYPVSAPSHPAAGTPIYLQPPPGSPYPQGPQMHHNSHPSYSHHQSSYSSHSHSTSGGNKHYQRNSTGQTTYYNQDGAKGVHKHHEKRINQQDPPPPFRRASNNNNNNNNSSSSSSNNNNDGESPKRNYGKTLIVNNSNASIDARNNSMQIPARQLDNKKVTVNHVKSEITDVSLIKDEDKEDNKRDKVEIPAAANVDNNNVIPALKDKPPTQETEVSRVPEEKVSPLVKSQMEVPQGPVKIVENPVEHNEVTVLTKNTQEQTPKAAETTTIVAKTVLSPASSIPSVPPPSTISWANVLKNSGPPGDGKSPTPITKLPVVRVNPINFPMAPVEAPVSSKISTPEVVSRNENVGVVASRNNGETTAKNWENSAWPENKSMTDTSQNNLKDPAVFRMGELLLKYQMDKQTVSLLPRGLTNRSNYCYINSILQALLACPPFYNLLMALPYPRNSMKNSSTPLIDNMVRFVREFNPLSEAARMPRKDKSQKRDEEAAVDVQCDVAFEPSYVYTMLKNTSCAGVFSVEGRQEDAEEFLSCLLNGISDEMLELMKLVNSESSDTAPKPAESNVNFSNAEEGWKVMGPKNKGSITRCTEFGRTPLSDIFRGQLRSRVLRTGDETTDNVQPFFTLQLDIEKAESVEAALEILVGKDQVEGMTCSKTKQQIEAWKQVLLEELPVILILHLKWFDYKLDGCSKIFKRVEFPIDLKVDSKLLSPNFPKKMNRKQKQYKLFAVTYHDGKEASKGHYVTDAFHVGYNAWVRYDDSSVKGIYEGDVLNPSPPRVPYLLYYRRCDTIGNNPPITTRTR